MKKIIFATGNQIKLLDAQRVFEETNLEIVGQKVDFQEYQGLDQGKIVKQKAYQAFQVLGSALFVDDTSFYLDSFPQFPGTMTKYINQTLGLIGLSKLFEEGQTGYFRTLLYFIDERGNEIVADGRLSGRLTKSISVRFNSDAPINSIFIPEGHEKPLSELSYINEIGNTHRVNALKELSRKLSDVKLK